MKPPQKQLWPYLRISTSVAFKVSGINLDFFIPYYTLFSDYPLIPSPNASARGALSRVRGLEETGGAVCAVTTQL